MSSDLHYVAFAILGLGGMTQLFLSRCGVMGRDRREEAERARTLAGLRTPGTCGRDSFVGASWSRCAAMLPGPRNDMLDELRRTASLLYVPLFMVLSGLAWWVGGGRAQQRLGFILIVAGCLSGLSLSLFALSRWLRWRRRCRRWPLQLVLEAMDLSADERGAWARSLGEEGEEALRRQWRDYIPTIGKRSWADSVALGVAGAALLTLVWFLLSMLV